MQASRRPSVSDLNLEEILLAMADSDKSQASLPSQFPTGTIKPRPLPTPQPRSRSISTSQPRRNGLPQDTEHHRHSYHTPEETHYPTGDMAPAMYNMNSPYHHEIYEGETSSYGYQYAAQNVPYYPQEEIYGYGETYPYPAEQAYVEQGYVEPYPEYYQEYAYYTPEQPPMTNSEYYYPYEYPVYEQPYGDAYGQQYTQQYYQEEFQPTQELRSISRTSSFSSTRRPLPRLPPKKKKVAPVPRQDIAYQTPPIQAPQHLSTVPQKSEVQSYANTHQRSEVQSYANSPQRSEVQSYANSPQQNYEAPQYPSSQLYRPAEAGRGFTPPPIGLENEANGASTESQENLAALMADITLHLSESGTSIDTRLKEAQQSLDATSSPSQTMSRSHSAKRNETNSQPTNNLMNSNIAPVPDSPAPPPRLSKEAAEMRLKNSPSKALSPIPNNPTTRETRCYQPATSSPLANFSQGLTKVAKAAARTPTNRPVKKVPTRAASSKPQNSIQLVNASRPVTDSGADGFDFDENDFEAIDRTVLAMTIASNISLESLVHDYLIPNLRYDWQRIRVIFLWIVENIRYDSQLLPVVRAPSPNVQSSSDEESGDEAGRKSPSNETSDDENGEEYLETPKAVLLRRACRQFGFANLFKAMAESAGLECEVIEGFLKDPNDAAEPSKTPEANHAWICVKIQGYYRFIDCGLSVPNHPYNIHKKLDLFYFLTNPSKLIFTHFPLNRAHQYLRPPIPFSSFVLLPFVTSTYFDFGVRFLDLPEGVLTIHEDQTGELNLSIPEDMKCWAEIEIPDPTGRGVRRLSPLVQCRAREDGRIAKVMLRVKGKSPTALLRFRCGYPQESKQLSYCFSLRLAHTGIKAPEEFVKILPSPAEFFIMDPLNFDLLYNIAYRFHVLPGSTESRHFKLALRSPSMKVHKFVYYPGDQGYIANVTLRERGQWAISYMVQSKEERPSKRDPWINVACYRCI